MCIDLIYRKRKKEPTKQMYLNCRAMENEFRRLRYDLISDGCCICILLNIDKKNDIIKLLKEHNIKVTPKTMTLDVTTMTKKGWCEDDFRLCAHWIHSMIKEFKI